MKSNVVTQACGLVKSILALCHFGALSTAHAVIISGMPNVNFDNSSYTLNFGSGAATYTFSDTNDFFNPVAVMTGGTAKIASLGLPFYDPPQPTSYFTDDRAPFIDGSLLALFLGYTTPATIPFSISDSYLALQFQLTDGIHYGYARIGGPMITEFGFETTPATEIQAGAQAVDEPTTVALFALVLFAWTGLTVMRRRPVVSKAMAFV